jgi:hypothetical protein
VQNAKTGAGALFLGAEFLVTLHGRSCSSEWEKPPRSFGILKRVSCWTTLVFNVWTTSILKTGENSSARGVSQTVFAKPSSRAWRRIGACHVGLATVPPGVHAGAGLRPPVRGRAPWALCAYVAWLIAHP